MAVSDRAAQVAQQFPGWHVWETAQGTPVATRTGSRLEPRTIICDTWRQLETQLAEQAETDQDAALSWA